MKKKILKIAGVLLLLVIGVLVAIPFFLEAKIGDILKNNVNNSVNADFDFSEASLSLIRSFPNAEVRLQDVSMINKQPFEGDTLFAAKEVSLSMGLMQLLKGSDEPISIKNIAIGDALLQIKVDENENANYDIAKETGSETSTDTEPASTDGFSFNMESYEITNTKISYDDFSTGIHLGITDMNHRGKGDLSLETSELDTHTDALVSFEMDSANYLNNNKIQLDALIGIDLKENKYSFLKNEALLNQLPLVFDGFIKMNDDNQEVDISFKTPSSDFKNFLAVIPEAYSKDIANVATTGNFEVEGAFEGIVDEEHIPKFNITINSDNASFKYPDLPKSVKNIFIDVAINNTTGIVEDTYVDINKASFMIDEDKFNLTSKITELMGNTHVNAHMDGKMNLANLEKAYPVPEGLSLKGLLDADISTAFDMETLEKKQYENTRTEGQMTLSDFEYKSEEMPNPVVLKTTSVSFNPKTVTLKELDGSTGKTDFKVTGVVNNFLGYFFNDENIEGNFNLDSNTFALNDFMVEEAPKTESGEEEANTSDSSTEKIKIPSFLDATFVASANTVLYDDITLKNVKGNLKIKDEKATLSNMTSSLFDGQVAFSGEVSTKTDTPTFAMKLGMDQLQVSETFEALELFKVLAPVAQVIKGTFSSDISLSGNLTDDFSPDLLSLSGDILADILTREISAEKAPMLTALDSKLNFLDLEQLNLKELKTKLSFKDGLVSVKPFTVNYKDIAINVDGNHTFDQKMNYKATLEVPAKYLGKDITDLIAKIDDSSLEGLTIPVTANIGGMYNSPEVTTDLSSGVKNLTNQLIEIQKQKLISAGKDKAKDLIGGLLSNNTTENDSTSGDDVKTDAKEVLGNILGTVKKSDTTTSSADTTATTPKKEETVKEAAKDILGGLFGKKKTSETETQKDSIK
ncbi:AsmA-like C-terminal region-containing protein [Maribacter sp. MMG018]|uniref:AsmA-like C-terminal region-containing protein n=1 Tax=Maribacter sp. MMG018 TaxID=2822688 RepID=UPI001B37CF29|nr:AsmA-like C-terminal region-containing protein [Maribacter sp. MMG018]MBQ4914052.1 AsmA-like C-terminal region-containing protein [Maribacter sp. MMG018]